MKCSNCGRTIPDSAKACRYCEAPAEPQPTVEELKAAADGLRQMDPHLVRMLKESAREADTAEDFVNEIGAVESGSSPPIPGDASGDGKVDFQDLLVLAQNYGKTGPVT